MFYFLIILKSFLKPLFNNLLKILLFSDSVRHFYWSESKYKDFLLNFRWFLILSKGREGDSDLDLN